MGMIVVSGVPCTGKSTLARQLGVRLGWPLLAKDDFKESLFDSLGCGDANWSRRLSDAAYAMMFDQARRCIAVGCSVILEGNFRYGEHELPLTALVDAWRRRDAQAKCIQVFCCAEPAVAIERFSMRERHAGHLDVSAFARIKRQLQTEKQRPLPLPIPTVECDTGYDGSRAIATAIDRVVASVAP